MPCDWGGVLTLPFPRAEGVDGGARDSSGCGLGHSRCTWGWLAW